MSFFCPVCGYPDLLEPPTMSFEICPSCGTEFGYKDFRTSHETLRAVWLRSGPRWYADWLPQPAHWQPRKQLLEYLIPAVGRGASFQEIRQASCEGAPEIPGASDKSQSARLTVRVA